MFDFLSLARASTLAQKETTVVWLLAALGAIFAVIVFGSIINAASRSRNSEAEQPHTLPADTGRAQLVRLGYLLLPLVIIFVLSAEMYLQAAAPPPDALDVTVVGKRWVWNFQHYPAGQREINELHVPVGQSVKLTLTSQDATHSLYVPALRLQQNAFPGRYTVAWFTATEPGEYRLHSARYSGTSFAKMAGRVVALSPADYQLWLSGNYVDPNKAVLTPQQKGAALFTQNGCVACHQSGGAGIGPALENRYGTTIDLEGGGTALVDDAYLRESIVNSAAKIVQGYTPAMPVYGDTFSDEQLDSLITYIKSLSGITDEPDTETTTGP